MEETTALLNQLKVVLSIDSDAFDAQLLFALDATLQEVLIYLNAAALPAQLHSTLVRIVAAKWNQGSFDGNVCIASLRRGDVATTYFNPKEQTSDRFAGFGNTLNAFRKLRYHECAK